MTKFVFINIPFHAHINPTLPIVQELVTRGEEVVYYLTEKYREPVEATGASFRSYASKLEGAGSDFQRQDHPLTVPMFMVDECLHVMPQILERVEREQADCIVYNPMCLSGRFVAQLLGTPAVISRAFFAAHEQTLRSLQLNGRDAEGERRFQAAVQHLCSLYPLQPFSVMSIFFHKEALNIVYVPRSFQPYGASFGDEFLFVGPSIGPRCEAADFPFAQLGTQPIIYVTSGTVFNNNPDFFKICFSAFADQPWQVVIATGRPVEQLQLGPIPQNVLIRSYVPQFELLQHVDVCVSHAGMATIMESIARGVPMVVLPQAENQKPNARSVARLELGILLEEDAINAESLRDAVSRVLQNPIYKEHVLAMQQDAIQAGGYKAAADALQHFVQTTDATLSGGNRETRR